MPQDFLADAPKWAVALFWAVTAISAGLFTVFVPRLRAALSRLAPPVDHHPDVAIRAIGAAFGPGMDAVKIGAELERIGDALTAIAKAAESLAKSEEAGTRNMLDHISDQLSRLEAKR